MKNLVAKSSVKAGGLRVNVRVNDSRKRIVVKTATKAGGYMTPTRK